MKPRTRKAGPETRKEQSELSQPTAKPLPASSETPPQVFILPKNISSLARIATLLNPATNTPNRYLICPETGVYEFTRVAGPKRSHRSWLLAPDAAQAPDAEGTASDGQARLVSEQSSPTRHSDHSLDESGYVLQSPDLFIATPLDPLFIILPFLIEGGDGSSQEYLETPDYFDRLVDSSTHVAHMEATSGTQELGNMIDDRIEAVSDCLDLGESVEKRYALSLPKLVLELVGKAKKMAQKGLPASMEARFVKEALQVPILSVAREESGVSTAAEADVSSTVDPTTSDSQETNASVSVDTASFSTAATSVSTHSAADTYECAPEVVGLLRLRTALNFIVTSYIPRDLVRDVQALLRDPTVSTVDFSPLDKRLAYLDGLRTEALALRSLSDNVGRKRSALEDDDDEMEKTEAKKRKKEEEELRKKNVSHGVKQLLKANTSGMQKLSSFFTKAPSKNTG